MRRKLIEVALPLEAINRESAREKSIRHGHPSTLHLWWARRPLAACRAVLFASLVDDPSSRPEEFPTGEAQDRERKRLFGIIEELVKWENSNNEHVLDAARKEILKSTDGNPPPVLDPFCGGGSIPLEAQRLGLEAHASDLNPVAVLITRGLIEIPPKFANNPAANPEARKNLTHSAKWTRAQGLADDVRYYGNWMRDQAEKRIGHLYPKVKLQDGGEATVIAWLWARTAKCPNPACGATMPLIRSYALLRKPGKQYRVVPHIEGREIRFDVEAGETGADEGTMTRRGAVCAVCGSSVDFDYIRSEGRAGRLAVQLMAIVAEDSRGRFYVAPNSEQEKIARSAQPTGVPDTPLPDKALGFRVQAYGMTRHRDLFTPRQLVALTTFSDLVAEAREHVVKDARRIIGRDGARLADGGTEAIAYADAVALYLGEAVSKTATFHNVLAYWRSGEGKSASGFGRQTITMTWDFAEINPFADAGGDFGEIVSKAAPKVLASLPAGPPATVDQLDARACAFEGYLVSTDPPYYDNVGYADLSDFFYVWLRRTLAQIDPRLFSTLLTPKEQELVAAPARFNGQRDEAYRFFESGLRDVFRRLRSANPTYPATVYYAFRQQEIDEDGAVTGSTGWESILEAMIGAELLIDATWPVRTENSTRMRATGEGGSNALASSIVIACRARPSNSPIATRRELNSALKLELPAALKQLQHSSIAAVDLAQAAIGPGMAIFSRYAKIVEADGSPMLVRSALQLINQALDEVLSEQENEYDAETRWAVGWFSDYGMNEGRFGVAEVLSKAKNTSVDGMERAGIINAPKGKVRLVARENLAADWDPSTNGRLTIWEVTQHLIQRLKSGGEQEAADLLRKVGGMGEIARDLAYRLYSICERKGWAEEALAYNSLVVAWPEISRLASETKPAPAGAQMTLP
ncbi:MAG TPA: DUF1156 domain-containing protein [Gemmatimonadaceae bacterium]|jgi:putative DNA methylase